MRPALLAIAFATVCWSASAMDQAHPLSLDEAREAVGTDVLTADAVRLGRMVAFREKDDGTFVCIVMLDRDLRVQTSALMVDGILRASDGSLRLPEDAATLAERMKLPLMTSPAVTR